MAKGYEVMEMLCPAGGWILTGDNFEGITWVDERPKCTKLEFESGFAKFDAWKAEQEKLDAVKTNAILTKLGITADELRQVLA